MTVGIINMFANTFGFAEIIIIQTMAGSLPEKEYVNQSDIIFGITLVISFILFMLVFTPKKERRPSIAFSRKSTKRVNENPNEII